MKVLIASTIVPFIEEGSTFIVDWLDKSLKEFGHRSEVLNIPFCPGYDEIFEQMLALRLLDVEGNYDRLITVRTPSYLLKHRNKVVWLTQHHWDAYGLLGTVHRDKFHTSYGLKIREALIQADSSALAEARKVYAGSKFVSDRLKRYNNIDSQVLYPPLLDTESFYCREYGDYIFCLGSLNPHKRQSLAIEAMKYTKSNVRLIIAGKPHSEHFAKELHLLVEKNELHHKVEIIDKWISKEEKLELFANALACVYIPFEQDSYGYPSLEACYSKKALISCSDSEGVLELVDDGMNGYVLPPDPKAVGECFDILYNNKDRAKMMGEYAYEKLTSMEITWENTIRRLTT